MERTTDVIRGEGEKQLVDITVDGDVISATAGHPFWVVNRSAWVEAGALLPGDLLITADGTALAVEAIHAYSVTYQTVYNLTVADLHTFYVLAGEDAILVHNTNGDPCKVIANVAERAAEVGHGVAGRTGKQSRLRELVEDVNVSSADRAWIRQEINQIERGRRKHIRLSGSSRKRVLDGRMYGGNSGKEFAHRRGFEASQGFGYAYSDLQDIMLHKLQHKYEGYK